MTYDTWHVGELHGDDGCVIRDESGLLVATCLSPEAAAVLVADRAAVVALAASAKALLFGLDSPLQCDVRPLLRNEITRLRADLCA